MPAPRALVMNTVFDGNAMVQALDKILLNATVTGNIEAQLRNVATVESHNETYLLYDFLDKGTKPHWIGKEHQLLANKGKDFGPIWGPVFHPGIRPYDITTRVVEFLNQRIDTLVNSSSAGSLASSSIRGQDDAIQWRQFRSTILLALTQAEEFAKQITPDNWKLVKDSYQLYIGDRKLEA